MVTREYPIPHYPTESRRFSRTVPPPHQSPYSFTCPERRYQLPTHDAMMPRHPLPERVEIEPESTPSRKRIAVACGRCRKRKIRCSGDMGHGQPCTNCKSAGVDPCLFLRVQSTETPLRPETSSTTFPYSLDTARRFHSGPTASPLTYESTSDLSPHHSSSIPDPITGLTYRNCYPPTKPSSADQGAHSGYYGVTAQTTATAWGPSIPPSGSYDDPTSVTSVDYGPIPTTYAPSMMAMYGAAPPPPAAPTRWNTSMTNKPPPAAYAPETTSYSPVYPPTTGAAMTATTLADGPGLGLARSDSYPPPPGTFPGMGRMASSLPTPPALVGDSGSSKMLPAPGSGSSRTPLPSSPGAGGYGRQFSDSTNPATTSSSTGGEVGSGAGNSNNGPGYYDYTSSSSSSHQHPVSHPHQQHSVTSSGAPISAARSTLPNNGSSLSINSIATTACSSSPPDHSSSLYSTTSIPTTTSMANSNNIRALPHHPHPHHHQGQAQQQQQEEAVVAAAAYSGLIFGGDQDLKSESSSDGLGYVYSHTSSSSHGGRDDSGYTTGGGGTGSGGGGYAYQPASVEMPSSSGGGSVGGERDGGARVGVRV